MATKKSESSLVPVEESSLATAELVQVMLEPNELKALVQQGFEAEEYVSVPDGGRIQGYFLGRGGDIEMNDPTTMQKRPVATWRVRHADGGVVMIIAGSAQLDSKLAGIPVGEFIIAQRFGESKTSSNRRVTNWRVLHNPRKTIKVAAPVARQGEAAAE